MVTKGCVRKHELLYHFRVVAVNQVSDIYPLMGVPSENIHIIIDMTTELGISETLNPVTNRTITPE